MKPKSKGEIILYKSPEGDTQIDVKLEGETVWLNQAQMVQLFQTTKQNVSLHLKNIYKEGELDKNSTVKEYLTIQKEGKRVITKEIEYYNLDVIISVGYRVKSKRGTQFRIWANKVLKDYLIKGYSLNEKKLKEHTEKIRELERTIELFSVLINTHLRTQNQLTRIPS